MLRILGTVGILALLLLDVGFKATPLGRRGSDPSPRVDAASGFAAVGEPMPGFRLPDLDGELVSLADFRGKRVLLTFERSLDW